MDLVFGAIVSKRFVGYRPPQRAGIAMPSEILEWRITKGLAFPPMMSRRSDGTVRRREPAMPALPTTSGSLTLPVMVSDCLGLARISGSVALQRLASARHASISERRSNESLQQTSTSGLRATRALLDVLAAELRR
jgi:hypothetical protein